MTDAAAEVARIRAEFAARDGAWMAVISREIAEHGPRTSVELATACGTTSTKLTRSVFATFLTNQKTRGRLVVVGTRMGPTGHLNNEWGMP